MRKIAFCFRVRDPKFAFQEISQMLGYISYDPSIRLGLQKGKGRKESELP